MANEVLNSLLKEYQQKKLNAEQEAEIRKQQYYDLFPRLQEIDQELNLSSISTAKAILFSTSSSSISQLQEKIKKLKQEKLSILQENGLSLTDLKPQYECEKCQDTGYLINSQFTTTMCTCLKQRLLDVSFHQSNMVNLERENFSTFNENLFSNKPDLEKYRVPLSPRENMKIIQKNCIQFVEHFDDPEQKNLLFTGSTGLR